MMIDWINFGQVSAERDENLSQYFFENGILQSVVENRHQFLILGRKGAGKTAVFKHFSDNHNNYISENDVTINSSLQSYSWNVHNLLSTDGKPSTLAYTQSWKYIIYLLAINKLISTGADNKKLKEAQKIISKIYSSPTPTLIQIVGEKLLQLGKLKLPGINIGEESIGDLSVDGGEVSFFELQNDKTLQNALNKSIDRLSDIFEDALLDTLKGTPRKVFICFDRIDEAWDSASFGMSQKIIVGLIGASEHISSKFQGSIRPIIFLREDIFETIDLNDKNKLRSDCGKLLAWTKEGLSRMILERVNFFARTSSMPEIARVEDLFDREQMRQQRTPFDHIMLRTMLRPRDFIKFFQLIKDDMISRKNNPFDQEQIDETHLECQAIYNAEPAYSEWLVEELKDEWRAQYPQIIDLFSAIQNYGKTNFTRDDLSSAISTLGKKATVADINTYLKFLFDNSIIGFRVGKSNQWRYKCFFNSQGFVESDLYKVHDGLHRGLNLTESRAAADNG